MTKGGIVSVMFWLILAALVVLHASSFAAAVTAVGGQTYNETNLLTGSGVKTSSTVTVTKPGNYSISGS
jgi:hypothetical protein